MNTQSDENAAKRRKVRKGTHSCWQCRRRKVKCTFSSPEDADCISCRRQGTECISQLSEPGPANNNSGHTEQVNAFSNQPADGAGGNAQPCLQSTAASSASETPLSGFPSFSTPDSILHGSSVEHASKRRHGGQPARSPEVVMVSKLPPTPSSQYSTIAEPTTYLGLTKALLLTLPLAKDLEILLDKVRFGMPPLCHQPGPKSHSPPRKEGPKKHGSIPNLLHPESHPVLLARQMLLFAVALQYLSPNEVIPGLAVHHYTTMRKLADSAIKLVTTNDALLGTLEGLENIILEAHYHTDGGNIRRAWITMRRAVMVAQLLGLHRPGHYRFKLVDNQKGLDPELMWACIMHMERILSLLLGLPTSTGTTSSLANQDPGNTSVQHYNQHTVTTVMAARVIERNQIQASQAALNMTRKIDRELVVMAEQLPSTFWRPFALAASERDSVDASSEAQRAWEHMCYYTLVNQLHLPYMLNPSHASQRVYSKVACVNASREILTRHITIRTLNRTAAYCRIGDFMALIAGMTLMLAHALSHCHKGRENLLVHQRLGDRATVERALECMQSMFELHEDALAAKCVTILKDVLAIEADAAQGENDRVQNLQGTQNDHVTDHKVLIVKVPYVGAIKIAREGITSVTPFEADQDQGLHEGVTIGGIGSIHVKTPRMPYLGPDQDKSDVAPAHEVTTQVRGASLSPQLDAIRPFSATSQNLILQQDQMFPDAAASMDDWVLQGFDTAFFDVLMRGAEGSGNELPKTVGGEEWDFNAFL